MATLESSLDLAFEEAKQGQSEDQALSAPPKQADAAIETKTPVEKTGAESAPLSEDSEELLDSKTYEKLKADPEKLRKELNRAWTQKTQALSEQRKALEPHLELFRALEENPEETIRKLAEERGLTIAEAKKEEVREAVSPVATELRQVFGPGLEDLADRLAPVLERVIAERIEPIKRQTDEVVSNAVIEEVNRNIELFTKEHSDWKKFEPEMMKISTWLQPAKQTNGKYPTTAQYMEALYHLATKDARKGDIVKETVERMAHAAAKSETAGSGVAQNRVAKSTPASRGSFDADFEEAAKDASEGILYE